MDPRKSICNTYFKVQKNIDTLREYKQWMKRRKKICKLRKVTSKSKQKWQIAGGRYKPEEDYYRQHMLEEQERRSRKAKKKKNRNKESKGIEHSQSLPAIGSSNTDYLRLIQKSSVEAPVTSMSSKPRQKEPRTKRRTRRGKGVNPAKQHHDIDENQLRESDSSDKNNYRRSKLR